MPRARPGEITALSRATFSACAFPEEPSARSRQLVKAAFIRISLIVDSRLQVPQPPCVSVTDTRHARSHRQPPINTTPNSAPRISKAGLPSRPRRENARVVGREVSISGSRRRTSRYRNASSDAPQIPYLLRSATYRHVQIWTATPCGRAEVYIERCSVSDALSFALASYGEIRP